MKLIDFSVTFILTLINIGILFFILRAILFKPVSRFIEARSAKIKGEFEAAAHDREEAKNLKALYEEKLKKAEDEAHVFAEAARKTAEERAAKIIADGKAQAEALLASARKQRITEEQAAYLLFRAEAAALVMQAASKLVKRELSSEDVRLLSENALKECSSPRKEIS